MWLNFSPKYQNKIIKKYMSRKSFQSIIVFLVGMFVLMPGFFQNKWGVVEMEEYDSWQINFDRVVVARLVKIRQDGLFSAGGLLGLGDVKEWDFKAKTTAHQYEVYENGEEFRRYLAYESHSGFQAIVFNLVERVTDFPPKTNLMIFRWMTAIASSVMLSLIAVWMANEFGWLAAALVLIPSAFSEWLILPAGSIFWNLWAFYLPFVVGIYVMAHTVKRNAYRASIIYFSFFFASLIKVLINGFEIVTTTLVMATVPLVYYSIRDRWGWSLSLVRLLKTGLALIASVVSGLVILTIQIVAHNGSLANAISYITETINRRATGDAQNYTGIYAESLSVSFFDVIWKYLETRAFTIRFMQSEWEILYLHLVILFFIFTVLFVLKRNFGNTRLVSTRGDALVMTTWYSILAPLSWFILFKPNAYIHTFLYPMVWHMPFVLFGFALSAYVLQDMFAGIKSDMGEIRETITKA